MYFDDLKIGMTVETAPAMIEKEKMMAFAVITTTFRFTQMRNMRKPPRSVS